MKKVVLLFFCRFRTDFIISGIAPLDSNLVVLLSFIIEEEKTIESIDETSSSSSIRKRKNSKPSEVHIVDFNGEQIANDVISLPGYESFKANDYRLGKNLNPSICFYFKKSISHPKPKIHFTSSLPRTLSLPNRVMLMIISNGLLINLNTKKLYCLLRKLRKSFSVMVITR